MFIQNVYTIDHKSDTCYLDLWPSENIWDRVLAKTSQHVE